MAYAMASHNPGQRFEANGEPLPVIDRRARMPRRLNQGRPRSMNVDPVVAFSVARGSTWARWLALSTQT